MTTSRHEIEIDVHTTIGIVRPGDTLVVAVSRPLDIATRDEMEHGIGERLPGVAVVVIDADALAVYRQEHHT